MAAKTPRKSFFWLMVLGPILVCLVAGTFLFRHFYQRQLWDPQTAALVNGQPIYQSALEEMLKSGLNPRPANHPQEGHLTVRQILDRLIIEELLAQEAAALGLTVSEAETGEALEKIRRFRRCQPSDSRPPCQSPPGAEMTVFLKALRQRQLLEKLAQTIIPREKRLTSRTWRSFWSGYLRQVPLGEVYQVRVLFVQTAGNGPASGEKPAAAKKPPKKETLEELEVQYRLEGLTTLISGPLSLNPLDPRTRSLFGGADLKSELEKGAAERKDGRPWLTRPLQLPNSLAVLEVRQVSRPLSAEELVQAARADYEYQMGQEAFWSWVAKLKERASIVINPNFSLDEPAKPGLTLALGAE